MQYSLQQHLSIYICQLLKLDAVACHTGFAYIFAIGIREVLFILQAEDIDRYPGGIAAHPDLKEILRFAPGILQYLQAIADSRIGYHLASLIHPAIIPEPDAGQRLYDAVMQCLHICALGLRLAGYESLYLLVYGHMAGFYRSNIIINKK